MKVYLSRSQSRAISADYPVGDPTGGAAFGEYNDPATIMGGTAIVGGLLQSDAAGDAADAQEAAAARSDATQRYQFDTTRADNAPFLNNGTAASNALAYRLGLSPSPTASAPSASSFKQLTGADLFDTSGADWKPNADLYASDPSYKRAYDQFIADHQSAFHVNPGNSRGSDANNASKQLAAYGFDINAANQSRQQANQPQAATIAAPAAPAEQGSLLRNFTQADIAADPVVNADQSYMTPMHDFGQGDLDNDLVYQNGLQFGLNEGVKGINRLAQASGSMLSGATLKALAKYGNDYGTTKTADAYSRFTQNQNTKYGIRNDAFNRFNTNQDRTYNKLAGLAGAGQTALSQVGAAGQKMANNISQSQQGVGNARAASGIGGTNALVGALNQGISSYYGNNQGGNYNSWLGNNSGLIGSNGLSQFDIWSAF